MCLDSDREAYYDAVRHARLAPHGLTVAEFYICNGRMRNFAIPIAIGGEILGCVYAGQFLVDMNKDKEQGKLEEILSRLDSELAYVRERSIEFGTPPSHEEINEIARLNNIPDDKRDKFRNAYSKNLAPERMKSLEDVVNAVYLLDEIAHTISSLGNAYYWERLASRVRNVVPEHLRERFVEKISRLDELTRVFGSGRDTDFTKRLREINRTAFDVLAYVKEHEENYVGNLLRPYDENLIVTKDTERLRLKYFTSQCRYRFSKYETMMRTARTILSGTSTLSPLSDKYEALCMLPAELTDLEVKGEADSYERLSQMRHSLDEAINDVEKAIRSVAATSAAATQEPAIDEVEHLFFCLSDPDVGLRRIKREALQHRALSGLNSATRALREDLRLR